MRIAAIIYIVASIAVNFLVDNFTVFILAMLSFPVLVWLLLKKKKVKPVKSSMPVTEADQASKLS